MNTLSDTQEFFLCAVNKKGEIPFLSTSETAACLVAGGIIELTKHGFITKDEEMKIIIKKPWDNSLPYLAPIYDVIASFNKPKKVNAVLEAIALSVTNKRLKELVSVIRESLIDENILDILSGQGIKKDKITYIPKPELVTRIIEKVRAEFLEDGQIQEDVLFLSVLLIESSLIKNYFSKVEVAKMKARIKEIRESDEYASVKDIFDYMDLIVAAMVIIIAAS